MVKLWDGWTIDTDEYQYILGKPVSTINKKGETENRTDKASYHLSLSQAVQAFYKQQARECIGKDEHTLSGAIVALRGIEERIKSMLSGVSEWDKKG